MKPLGARAALAGGAVLAAALVALPAGGARGQQSTREIAQTSMPSVVSLVMHFDATSSTFTGGFMIRTRVAVGSGFFVKEDVIATNAHVVANALGGHARRVTGGDRTAYDVEGILAIDEKLDLALVRVTNLKGKPLALGDAAQLGVGDDIYAVGSPSGLEGTFSPGIVSGLRTERDWSLVQITAPISPGSSGGPILNRKGEVVGVAVGTLTQGQNLNFAVSVAHLRAMLDRPVRWKALARLPQRLAMNTTPQLGTGAAATPAAPAKADIDRPDPAIEARKDFQTHLRALLDQTTVLTGMLSPPPTRDLYLPAFKEFEARLARFRGRLPGQSVTAEVETLLKACERLTAAEETWSRELVSAEHLTSHRRALETAKGNYAQRPSFVNRLEQNLAEENVRAAEQERAKLEKERLGHWDAATRALGTK